LTYLEAQNKIVAVDDIEKRDSKFDARPYAFANPQFRDYPVFGNFRGHDNPELIMALDPQPQVILKTYPTMGHDPVELQKKTGIPVVVLEYGNLTSHHDSLYQALRVMGAVVGRDKRAEEVIAFFESTIEDLKEKTADIPESEKKTCFVGGIAFKGPHGFQSTEPGYPPFLFVNAKNVAYQSFMKGKVLRQSNVAKEKIVEWDPEILFLDLSTLQMGEKAGGLFELKSDAAYQALTAVAQGEVYGVLPYNWYTQNFGSILANAFFIGKLLYPDRFAAVDPVAKADEIYAFLVGKPVFGKMDRAFQGLALKKIPLN
jgi:iron complex transport system substrate-binding protein